MNGAVRQSHLRRQIARTPMTHTGLRRLQGHRHDLSRFTRTHLARPTAPRLIVQPVLSRFGETATNPTDLNCCIASQQSYLCTGDIVSHQQYGPSPSAQACSSRRGAHNPFKFGAIIFRQNEGSRMVRQ
jgi:hypothetical protein